MGHLLSKNYKRPCFTTREKKPIAESWCQWTLFENSIFPQQNLVKVMQSDTNEWHTTDEKTLVNSSSVPHPLLVSVQKFLLAPVSALKYYEVPLGASAYYLWWVRDLDLGLSWCFDGHQCLVLEHRYAPEILVGDVSVASVLVQQLQLHIGVPNQVVQLILLGFEISLKTNLAYLIKGLPMILTNFRGGSGVNNTAHSLFNWWNSSERQSSSSGMP